MTPDSLAQNGFKSEIEELSRSIAEEEALFPGETHSRIEPYVVRDHAWNLDGHDTSNFYDYRDDAPAGYKEMIKY